MKFSTRIFKTMAAAIGVTALLHAYPAHADSVHIAGESTTFYTLSNYYGISADDIMKANPDIAALNIYPGLRLTIPGITSISASTTQASKTVVAESDAAAGTSILNVQPATNTLTAWGKPYSYNKVLQVKATAYSAAASENGKWGAVDYFGNPLKLGTIAVDPSVIPLGTKVLVTGYTHPGLPKEAFVAVATDMGSAIKGNRIDIFIPGSQSFVSDFGFQYVNLYFLN